MRQLVACLEQQRLQRRTRGRRQRLQHPHASVLRSDLVGVAVPQAGEVDVGHQLVPSALVLQEPPAHRSFDLAHQVTLLAGRVARIDQAIAAFDAHQLAPPDQVAYRMQQAETIQARQVQAVAPGLGKSIG